MDHYSEATFFSDFKKKYDMTCKNDYSNVFYEYYADFIEENSVEFIIDAYSYYFGYEGSFNGDALYQTLYNRCEKMIIDGYESEPEFDLD